MSGPCSVPKQDKSYSDELNEIVCDIHFNCKMQLEDNHGNPITHDYITYREWLRRRNRLRTGKTG